jgi:hypothetical protein
MVLLLSALCCLFAHGLMHINCPACSSTCCCSCATLLLALGTYEPSNLRELQACRFLLLEQDHISFSTAGQ